MTQTHPLDPLGELIQAGLEIERAKNDTIAQLSAEVVRLTRELNKTQGRALFGRDYARVAAMLLCSCCRVCGVIVPCVESLEGDPCADRCFCLAPSSRHE